MRPIILHQGLTMRGLTHHSGLNSPTHNTVVRYVTEPAKIRFRKIWILCFKSIRCGFATRSQLVLLIAIYQYLYTVNTKSDDMSWSHSAFNII